MNEQLKFSWGHIFAFLALIVISYISFVGVTYYTNGNFVIAGISVTVIDILLFTFFLGAQIMKSTDHKFARRIWIERIFIFGSPIIFIISMLPYFHFWVVNSQNKEIVANFTTAINASKKMFDNYESYSYERIENYNNLLDCVISNKSSNKSDFIRCGFIDGKENIQKENMIKTLQLQLLSSNYDSLKNEAIKWIDASSRGASTFNVFLLGNTKEIKSAICEWNGQLSSFSSKKLSNEDFYDNVVPNFNERDNSLDAVYRGFDKLTSSFVDIAFPNLFAIITAFILYFMMLFPWFLQDRHTKNPYGLIKNQAWKSDSVEENSNLMNSSENNNEEDGDFGSFTL